MAEPQWEQKRAVGDTGVPHAGQLGDSRDRPQAEQNRPVPGTPQEGQVVGELLTRRMAESRRTGLSN
ncbi:MAG TPA: hypothetical protein VFH40_07105 [Gemmatimonadales bacterium]|nr:hypothetical protein [Gemmatimonadales bacterium]